MNALPNRALRASYYLIAVAFHFLLFFTNAGNYFHNGKPIELIGLQVMAVIICAISIRLLQKVQMKEKILIVFSALIPLAFIASSLLSSFAR